MVTVADLERYALGISIREAVRRVSEHVSESESEVDQ